MDISVACFPPLLINIKGKGGRERDEITVVEAQRHRKQPSVDRVHLIHVAQAQDNALTSSGGHATTRVTYLPLVREPPPPSARAGERAAKEHLFFHFQKSAGNERLDFAGNEMWIVVRDNLYDVRTKRRESHPRMRRKAG